MSNSHECMWVNEEALQLCIAYKKNILYYKSRENPYQYFILQVTWESVSILQVTQEFVSGTSHLCSIWMC